MCVTCHVSRDQKPQRRWRRSRINNTYTEGNYVIAAAKSGMAGNPLFLRQKQNLLLAICQETSMSGNLR